MYIFFVLRLFLLRRSLTNLALIYRRKFFIAALFYCAIRALLYGPKIMTVHKYLHDIFGQSQLWLTVKLNHNIRDLKLWVNDFINIWFFCVKFFFLIKDSAINNFRVSCKKLGFWDLLPCQEVGMWHHFSCSKKNQIESTNR